MKKFDFMWRRNLIVRLTIVLLTILAVSRVILTHSDFSHAYDEPTNILAGLELLDRGSYQYQRENPPIARLAIALGPYIEGARIANPPGVYDGRLINDFGENPQWALMYGSRSYDRLLSLARLGNIPFLLLLLCISWIWTNRLFGFVAGLTTSVLLITLSPILGHAGLATTDVACAATVLAALYAFSRWLEYPSTGRALLMGFSSAFAIMVKFSAIPFLTLSMAAILLYRSWLKANNTAEQSFLNANRLKEIGVAILVAIGVFWLTYGFHDPLDTAPILNAPGQGNVAPELAKDEVQTPREGLKTILRNVPLPIFARDMTSGIRTLAHHNSIGHWSYLLGETGRYGWWHYYLVGLAVKTPFPLLLLGFCGLCYVANRSRIDKDWRTAVPAISFVAILVFTSATSRINSGVRHILILYPFAAIAAGAFVSALYARRRHISTALAAILLMWQTIDSFRVHPDYLADFNFLAGDHPETMLIDSDLDSGQDLKRLAQEVANRRIENLSVSYYGSADVGRHIPGRRNFGPYECVTGWIAISLTNLSSNGPGYAWLKSHQPVSRIGRSIALYYLDPAKVSESSLDCTGLYYGKAF